MHSGGTVYYKLSTYDSLHGGKIKKPLIVAEGFDKHDVAPKLQDNYTFQNFIKDMSSSGLFDINFKLDSTGYDLIFLDYNRGTDDIVRNAALLQEVIDSVNHRKALAGSSEQNIVLGVSMGGLVARYCLANMTKQSLAHQTKLLITDDSPHQGANIPLGLQFLVKATNEAKLVQVLNLFDIFPELSQANAALNATASQQMLILRATNGTGSYATNTWLSSTYRNMITFQPSGPQPTYKIEAMSSGSECGITSINPSYNLFSCSGGLSAGLPQFSSTGVFFDCFANALPAYGSSSVTISKLHIWSNYTILSVISINADLTNETASSPSNTFAWDGVAGGFLYIDPKQSGNTINFPEKFIDWKIFKLTSTPTYGLLFSFVPTVSALDITTISQSALAASYVGGISPTNPARVANFIATGNSDDLQVRYNAGHATLNLRNAEWLFDEITGKPNNKNCSSNCVIDFGGSISGSSTVCSSNNTFTSTFSSSVSSVSWSNSSNLNYVSGQNTMNYAVKSNAAGSGYVTVTPSNVCGAGKPVTKTLTVGTGVPPSSVTMGRDDCYDQRFSAFPTTASYNWTVINASTGSSTYYPNYGSTLITSLGSGNYSVIVASSCPSTQAVQQYFTVNCSSGGGGSPKSIIAFPNSASSQLNISTTSTDSAVTAKTLEISLIDDSGTTVRSQTVNQGDNVSFDLTSLKKGFYYLRIEKGTFVDSRHIIIE